MPAPGHGVPLVVGEKVFTLADSDVLLRLWAVKNGKDTDLGMIYSDIGSWRWEGKMPCDRACLFRGWF
jgi:hypothetical protein